MSKYTVLMVDDEENVIRAMQKKIDWESIGFRIMGYAHNGIEALDLAEQEAPDVVLTDIKMPYMDGLELAHNLKIMYPTVRILIFSGFDEFEYAKEAIRLEVEEYILKPVDADELRRIFMRIKESLDQEMDEKRNVQKLRDYYMERSGRLSDQPGQPYVYGSGDPYEYYAAAGRHQRCAPHRISAPACGRASEAEVEHQNVLPRREYGRPCSMQISGRRYADHR